MQVHVRIFCQGCNWQCDRLQRIFFPNVNHVTEVTSSILPLVHTGGYNHASVKLNGTSPNLQPGRLCAGRTPCSNGFLGGSDK